MTSSDRTASSAMDEVNTGWRESKTAVHFPDRQLKYPAVPFFKGGGYHLLSMYLVSGVASQQPFKISTQFLHIGS